MVEEHLSRPDHGPDRDILHKSEQIQLVMLYLS